MSRTRHHLGHQLLSRWCCCLIRFHPIVPSMFIWYFDRPFFHDIAVLYVSSHLYLQIISLSSEVGLDRLHVLAVKICPKEEH